MKFMFLCIYVKSQEISDRKQTRFTQAGKL